MYRVSKNWQWLGWGTICSCLMTVGCSNEPVREDRSINFSADGQEVAFQHGAEGVFVAGDKVDQPVKIFDAGEETIAVSSPLWSPTDKRLIFTAARPAHPESDPLARQVAAWDASPTGRQFQPEDVVYSCLLRPEPGAEPPPEPVVLFEAACSHPGYVAANLAVRWHPDGERILFVDRTSDGRHSLFEFTLATRVTRQVLPQSAAALIFDWTPNRSHLVCVLAHAEIDHESDGIWIRAAEGDDWWRVHRSENLARGESNALLERLRSTRPAWTIDDRRLAFIVHEGGKAHRLTAHAILAADTTTREVQTVFEGPRQLRDLNWHPDGQWLGFVELGEPPMLRILDATSGVSIPVKADRVRRFAGWNHQGTRLAFITPEPVDDPAANWALLFPRVRAARDEVHVADGTTGPARMVHDGIRVTFPQWSPSEDKLSVWGTYAPTHQSLLSLFLPWTLRSGDPAAILDIQTGRLEWMAVNAHENAQVGHYYLLKRDYSQAWEWYALGAKDREPAGPIKLAELDQFIRQLRIHQNPTFFEYYCLEKLGRHEDAAERLGQFRASMIVETEGADDLFQRWGLQGDQLQVELQKFSQFAAPLMQSAYMTEVFLSLDAAEDGAAFFERELAVASNDAQRFAPALCLSQLLLAQGAHDKYADLVTTTLGPLLIRMSTSTEPWSSFAADTQNLPELRERIEQTTIFWSGGLALLPMMSEKFLASFGESQLEAFLARWQVLRDEARNDRQRWAIDLLLLATWTKLGAEDKRDELKQRIRENPQLGPDLGLDDPGKVDEFIERIQTFTGQ